MGKAAETPRLAVVLEPGNLLPQPIADAVAMGARTMVNRARLVPLPNCSGGVCAVRLSLCPH